MHQERQRKPQMRMILASVVLTLVATVSFLGCGDSTKARLEVAKEAAIKKLDSLLGSMDVKRKEIDLQLKGLSEGVAGIKKFSSHVGKEGLLGAVFSKISRFV